MDTDKFGRSFLMDTQPILSNEADLTRVSSDEVIRHLCNQIAELQYQLAIARARADMAEGMVKQVKLSGATNNVEPQR
jgi:hypothetical protein